MPFHETQHEPNGLLPSREAFRVFYDRYFIPLFYYARGYVNNEPAAEDIATETFLRLWKTGMDYDNSDKVRNFLYGVARNLSLDHLRVEKRRLSRDGEFAYLSSEPSEEALRKEELTGELFGAIYAAADRLPEQLRQVFTLAYLEGLSNEEVAQKMNISNQTVRNYKAAALKNIRTSLSGKDLYPLWLLVSLYKWWG